VFFGVDGMADPASLPAAGADSLGERASAFLLDVDPASPTAFMRVPVRFDVVPGRLAMRPDDGHPLRPGGRYAAVVTTDVRAIDGAPIVPAAAWAALRDATDALADPLAAAAYALHAPVLASLEGNGVRRERIAGLAAFRVMTVTDELTDARERIWGGDAPVVGDAIALPAGAALDARLGTPALPLTGLDVEGGVVHSAIGFVVDGAFDAPNFLAAAPGVHGRFGRDAEGRTEVRRVDRVPFTLVLPRAADLSALRVVIFQHGLGAERSDVFGLADSLASAGYAVVAIDAPYHGMRAARARLDEASRFTGAMAPDGFGDATGAGIVIDFAGILDAGGDLESFSPVYLRDALRQAACDLMTLTRVLREGDWSAVRAADPGLAGLGFASEPFAFVGVSLGGIIGTIFTAMEPDVGAAMLVVTGGHLVQAVAESPPFNAGYFPQLFPLLGLDASAVDYAAHHPVFFPELAVWQTLLDRGDSIAYASALARRPVDVLALMARDDETVNNLSTESLAAALGLSIVGARPAYTSLPEATAPVRGNVTIDGETRARALFVHGPATHGLLLYRGGTSRYAHPVRAPFEEVAEAPVPNPVDAALAQSLHFVESWRSGAAEIATPPD
jgi:hypothetical protein